MLARAEPARDWWERSASDHGRSRLAPRADGRLDSRRDQQGVFSKMTPACQVWFLGRLFGSG
jgi:hypothetical protein